MIAWFARNHVAANLLMITLLALGIGSLHFKIPLEVFPTIEPRTIRVTVAVPGAMPEDLERSVSVKLEEAVQDLEGLEDIISNAREGSSTLILTLDERYQAQDILTEVKNRIDAVNNLPADAERPVVSLAKRQREVISIAISGDLTELEVRQQAERVRDQLLELDGITQVELDGVRKYEISIDVKESTLQQYGLEFDEIAQAIRANSQDLSAGSIKTLGGEVLIRSGGQAYDKDDFDQIPILARDDGSLVYLKELAEVKDGFSESKILTRFNGQTAAFVDVFRVGQQSAIEVADKVYDYLGSVKEQMPPSVTMTPWRDRSKIVKKRLKTLSDNAIQGGILVMLLLTLFLRPAIAFWVCIGIPVSFMGALLVMPLFDITINVISLFGFIVILGIVVDDAIVTGENIYSHLRRSENGLQAVINGTKEVAVPVTFGILTTVAAFLPIAFIEGVRGQLFAAIPVVVIPILVFSLIESKLVLPAHLKHINVRAQQGNSIRRALSSFQQRFADGFEHFVLSYYYPALKWALKNRYLCLSLSVGVLIILYALLSSGWMRFIFFPKVQSELARATLEMPVGTPVEVTDKYVLRMLQSAQALKAKYEQGAGADFSHTTFNDSATNNAALDENTVMDSNSLAYDGVIRNIMSSTGSGYGASGSQYGRVMLEIVSPEDRSIDITSRELVNEWRAMIGNIPGAEKLTFRAEIGRVSDPIQIQLKGKDFDQLVTVAEAVKDKLRQYPSVYDISDSYSDGKEALEVKLRPEAYRIGLTRQVILSQIRTAFYGIEVQRIQRGRDDIKVMLRYPESDRNSLVSLNQFLIKRADGTQIPLSHVASLHPVSSPATISRTNLSRTIDVYADVNKQNTNMLVLQKDLKAFIDQKLVQYPDLSYDMDGEAKEQRQSFGSLKWGVIFVLFIIYSLLAIPFKSYWQPIIVMAVIPFGAIGAIGGHWIMGMDLTLISLLGMLALIGIVVNDSLVLVDFINKRRAATQQLFDSVSKAAAARFRPVILTSLTTFFGLMPLLFEKSTQAQFLIPMAVSLGFGILFATLITLFMVPINYLVIEDVKRWYRGGREDGGSNAYD